MPHGNVHILISYDLHGAGAHHRAGFVFWRARSDDNGRSYDGHRGHGSFRFPQPPDLRRTRFRGCSGSPATPGRIRFSLIFELVCFRWYDRLFCCRWYDRLCWLYFYRWYDRLNCCRWYVRLC